MRWFRTKQSIIHTRLAFGKDQNSRDVLGWLMQSGGVLRRIDNEDQRIAHNYVITLLENMGLTQGINYQRIVDFLIDKTAIPEEAVDK